MITDLRNQFIDETFDGLLHSQGEALPVTGRVDIYDGSGNKSDIKIGRDGNGVTTTELTIGSLKYPNTPNAVGSYMVQGENNELILLATDPNAVVKAAYPIGSIYLSVNGTNPSALFAGTSWVQISQGKFLVGVGSGSDGHTTRSFGSGNNSGEYSHTLTESELAPHSHTASFQNSLDTGDFNADPWYTSNNSTWGFIGDTDRLQNVASDRITISNAGGNVAFNTTPPGFGIYVWQRTA